MEEVAVVVVPLPAQGHLNQLLHFALHLSSHHGLSTHFATSASHNRQAKLRLQGWSPQFLQNIHFHDLPCPPFPTPPPSLSSTSSTKFPSHLIPSFYAAVDLEAPLFPLLRSLSHTHRRLVVVHDPMMAFAGREAEALDNAESYMFQCIPPFNELPYFWHTRTLDQIEPPQRVLDVITAQFDGTVSDEFWEFVGRQDFDVPGSSGMLFNTCRAIEGEFLDLLPSVPRYQGKKLFTVGPLNPTEVDTSCRCGHECLQWLDKQPARSVVYVSFGSTTTVLDEQIKQLAAGLRRSRQRFLWVVREADRGDIFAGDENRVDDLEKDEAEGLGIVVRGWAPQLEILAHPSTGTFVSHCGWNSCMESISMGVPMITWPMHSDQPRNAKMVTDYLKVGAAVGDWGRRGEVVMGEEIAEVIERVMVGDEGKEIREKARMLGVEARRAMMEGRPSRADITNFVAHITR